MDENDNIEQQDVDTASVIDAERREALARLGRYAAHTPPVILTLLSPRASADVGSLGVPPGTPD